MKYGYACTIATDQNNTLQFDALKRARCRQLFEDRLIGNSNLKRPALTRCLKTLGSGDTLVVWKLDRLGYSLRDLILMLTKFRDRGIRFQSLFEAIDTATPTGHAICQVMETLAKLDASVTGERTRAGVKAAQSRGVKVGRKPRLSGNDIIRARNLIQAGESRRRVADLLNVSRTTLYRTLRD
jgi:DNA invertase Pin-like site-specific DNA recombinase